MMDNPLQPYSQVMPPARLATVLAALSAADILDTAGVPLRNSHGSALAGHTTSHGCAVSGLAASGGEILRMERDWQVLLIGGASGVGKTSVSYRLAHHFGVGITEIDDFQVILEHMTTPEQYPELHLFRTEPETFFRMDDHEKVAHMVRYATVMAPALEQVIANHLEDGSPVILEGGFIMPSLAVRGEYAGVPNDGRVRAMVIYEPEEAQIARNYATREGESQPVRARASWRNSEWLRAEAERRDVPTIEAPPWDTVFERALAAVAPAGS